VTDLVEQQQATGFQAGFRMAQGMPDVAGGVQDVGRDHQVVGTHLDALCGRRLLDIDESVGEVRMVPAISLFRVD